MLNQPLKKRCQDLIFTTGLQNRREAEEIASSDAYVAKTPQSECAPIEIQRNQPDSRPDRIEKRQKKQRSVSSEMPPPTRLPLPCQENAGRRTLRNEFILNRDSPFEILPPIELFDPDHAHSLKSYR